MDHAPGGYSLRVQPPGGTSQIGAMLKDNARPLPVERADRRAWERPRGAPQGQGQPPGGRSSFAFDDYAGQEDQYLGRAVPRQQRKHFPDPGADPPGGYCPSYHCSVADEPIGVHHDRASASSIASIAASLAGVRLRSSSSSAGSVPLASAATRVAHPASETSM